MTHQEMEIRIKELENQVKALEQELTTERIEYGTDGNRYVLSMTNGRELEQEPCDDAISRQAVLESIKNLYPDMPVVDIMGSRRKWSARYAPYFECENAVEQLPSVNPKVKTGHWTIKENGHVKCSKCLIVQPYSSIFCPNCGARMVEL